LLNMLDSVLEEVDLPGEFGCGFHVSVLECRH
jgi:hypothetical protein